MLKLPSKFAVSVLTGLVLVLFVPVQSVFASDTTKDLTNNSGNAACDWHVKFNKTVGLSDWKNAGGTGITPQSQTNPGGDTSAWDVVFKPADCIPGKAAAPNNKVSVKFTWDGSEPNVKESYFTDAKGHKMALCAPDLDLSLVSGNCPPSGDYNFDIFEGGLHSDGVVDLGGEIQLVAMSPGVAYDLTLRLIDPSGTVVLETTEHSDAHLVLEASAEYSLNQPGEWTAEADFHDGTVMTSYATVGIFVVPESSIGIVALIGSSLAALGGFIVLKRRHSNSPPHSISDLGI